MHVTQVVEDFADYPVFEVAHPPAPTMIFSMVDLPGAILLTWSIDMT
jgi:hypothetical protein